jgi:transposase
MDNTGTPAGAEPKTPRPKRSAELQPQLRGRILALRDIGWSLSAIAQKHNLPKSTVQYTVQAASLRSESQVTRQRTGRPKATTEEQRQALFKAWVLTPGMTYKELQEQEAPNASVRTVQKIIKEMKELFEKRGAVKELTLQVKQTTRVKDGTDLGTVTHGP